MGNTKELRIRRQLSGRRKIVGSNERPRLVIHRSNTHIYAQVIDDSKGNTLASCSTINPVLRDTIKSNNIFAAETVGKEIAKIAFDRAGYLYNGRIKALAEAARSGGLIF